MQCRCRGNGSGRTVLRRTLYTRCGSSAARFWIPRDDMQIQLCSFIRGLLLRRPIVIKTRNVIAASSARAFDCSRRVGVAQCTETWMLVETYASMISLERSKTPKTWSLIWANVEPRSCPRPIREFMTRLQALLSARKPMFEVPQADLFSDVVRESMWEVPASSAGWRRDHSSRHSSPNSESEAEASLASDCKHGFRRAPVLSTCRRAGREGRCERLSATRRVSVGVPATDATSGLKASHTY